MINTMVTGPQYPLELVDPREKEDKKYILQYCRAAWAEYVSGDYWWNAAHFERIRLYARAEQPIDQYKQSFYIDEDDRETWLNISFENFPIMPKFRQIGLARMGSTDYKARARAIDPTAIEEDNNYFKRLEAKIEVRAAMANVNPQLAASLAKPMPGEPVDLEELELHKMYTYKNRWSQEMELALRYVFVNSTIKEEVGKLRRDMFDFGVGVMRERFTPQGDIVCYHIPASQVVVSRCRNRDFSDMRHAGEIVYLTVSQICLESGMELTTEEKRSLVERASKSYNGMINVHVNASDEELNNYKIPVLKLEFLSLDEAVYEEGVDSYNNKRFSRFNPSRKQRSKNKYYSKKFRSLYKGSWVVGTEMIYDYGKANDQLRSSGNLAETRTSFHIYAADLHNGRPYGVTEQAIPVINAIQLDWLKMQQLIAETTPKGIAIDLDALEDINFGAAGQKMDPRDILKMFKATGSMPYRGLSRFNQHRGGDGRPIHELENGMSADVERIANSLAQKIDYLRQITGINEMVDGSSPNPRTLNVAAHAAMDASNNALRHIKEGEMNIVERLSRSACDRIRKSLERGRKFTAMVKALGSDTMEFLELSTEIVHREFNIEIVEVPTDMERQQLIEQAKAFAGEGLIELDDVILIQTTDNLLQAQHILAHRISKRKKEEHQKSMELQQMNGQIQQQSAQVAENEKRATIQAEGQVKAMLIELEYEKKKELAQLEGDIEMQIASGKIGADLTKAAITASDSPLTETATDIAK